MEKESRHFGDTLMYPINESIAIKPSIRNQIGFVVLVLLC